MAGGRLQFTTDIERAVAHGTQQFIAVGTPSDEDGSADVKCVLAAARSWRGAAGPRRGLPRTPAQPRLPLPADSAA